MQRNLDSFYSVQIASGTESAVFLTEQEAQAFRQQLIDYLNEEDVKADRGEVHNQGVFDSRLEFNYLDGTVQNVYEIADWAMPSNVQFHPAGSCDLENWQRDRNIEKIRWGNLAMARP